MLDLLYLQTDVQGSSLYTLSAVVESMCIGEDLHQKGGAMKVMAPEFKGTEDCKEFSIIDIIVSFCR